MRPIMIASQPSEPKAKKEEQSKISENSEGARDERTESPAIHESKSKSESEWRTYKSATSVCLSRKLGSRPRRSAGPGVQVIVSQRGKLPRRRRVVADTPPR